MKQNKWFWPWQDEEERWLIGQAQNGLVLTSKQFPYTYLFEHGSAKITSYRLDYFDPKKEDLREYMHTCNKTAGFYWDDARLALFQEREHRG